MGAGGAIERILGVTRFRVDCWPGPREAVVALVVSRREFVLAAELGVQVGAPSRDFVAGVVVIILVFIFILGSFGTVGCWESSVKFGDIWLR